MSAAEVQVRFLVASAEDVPTSGGLDTEMCPHCFALVPMKKVQNHIEAAHADQVAKHI
jgi:hypothetical protein